MKNLNKLTKIVNEVIKKSAREEALKILKLSSKKGIDEFIKYYKDDKHNICCLHLDKLKSDLVSNDKMTYNKTDNFGHMFIEFKNK